MHLPFEAMKPHSTREEDLPAEWMPEVLRAVQTQRLLYQECFDFASEGFAITDGHGIIHEANYAAARLLNARREFLLGKPLGLFLSESSRRRFYAELVWLGASGRIEPWDALLHGQGGEPREISLAAIVTANEVGQHLWVRWLLRDISSVRQTERALRDEKHLSDGILDTAEILILITDREGRILRCNPFVRAVMAREPAELLGQSWCETLVLNADQAAARLLLKQTWQTGAGRSGILSLSGLPEQRFVSWFGRRIGERIVLLGHDVTQLQEEHRKRLQAERLAAIGQMAAGLAHESRNALQRSQACLSILQLRLKDEPELLDLLARLQKAQDDLRHLFDDVRNYAADLPLKTVVCDLRGIWREAWADLAGLSEWASAELVEECEGASPFCMADPFYLKQVFRNLLENALACGAHPVRIVLHCRWTALDGRESVEVRVRDNGPGFPPGGGRQLFEPFFTTKVRGTGLGLPICKRIIEAHGGTIGNGAEATPGAEIRLVLPRRRT